MNQLIKIDGFTVDPNETLIQLDRADCEESLAAFVRLAWHIVEPGQPYVHGWHIDALCAHLEAVTAGEEIDGVKLNRLLINIPPGTMKSLLVGVFWPAWEWGPQRMPHLRYLCASHSQNLAIRDNVRMRRLVVSEWYQERWPHVSLAKDQNAKLKFENTALGFREAVAAGTITGSRGDRVIIDDPSSVESAASDQQRQTTSDWFLEAVPTRLNSPKNSAIIVIMQRLHEEDISGLILDKGLPYTHLMLPMEYEPDRACSTPIEWWPEWEDGPVPFADPRDVDGELLFPERFPPDVVERDKAVMGPYAVAGQLQQRPEPRGGGIIKREWWQLWEHDAYPAMDFIVASLDTAYTTKSDGDYSALTVWGVFSGDVMARSVKTEDGVERAYSQQHPRVMLMTAWAERLELHELVKKTADTCRSMKVDRLLIENKAAGISVAQEIRRLFGHEDWAVMLIDPKSQDKLARLYSIQHLFAEGMVYSPDRAWADKVITQVGAFPRGKHDDLCFVAGTKIATNKGDVDIKDIIPGNWVVTPKGLKKVIAAGSTGVKPVIAAKGLIGTPNHPVFIVDKGWCDLDTVTHESPVLRANLCDLIRSILPKQWNLMGFNSAGWAGNADIIFPPTQQTRAEGAQKDCTLSSGSISLGQQFLLGMRCITKMAIRLTVILQTWSVYRLACIVACLKKSTWKSKASTWKASEALRAIGTNLKKVALGIKGLVQNTWIKREQSILSSPPSKAVPANGAADRFCTKIQERYFAGTNVPLNTLSSSEESGKLQTHITQQVFNLTIEDAECYYANGILVHNCDTVSQALRHMRELGMLTRGEEWTAQVQESMRHTGRDPAPLYGAP